MANHINPVATDADHLPFFITAPDQTDVLLGIMAGVLVLFAVLIGVFYFRLHHLPEHLASRSQKVQYEIVAVLALIAMFTHNHAFWIAGLLLAFVQIPDFTTPLTNMSKSLAKMAGTHSAPDETPVTRAELEPSDAEKPRDALRH